VRAKVESNLREVDFLNSKGILITGGSGLLAVNWAASVRDRCPVTLVLNKRAIALRGVSSYVHSIDSVDSVTNLIQTVRPDFVVHTAGLTNVEICESHPELATYLNVQLSKYVATACARSNIKLVHISTDHLFSGDKSLVGPQEKTKTLNVYAKTKREAEQTVLEINPDALIVRTNFYAWGTGYRESFTDKIINSLRSSKKISLFDDIFFTPILVEVLVKAVHDLVREKASDIFHVVGDERVSKYEFGLRVARVFGLDHELIERSSFRTRDDLVQRPLDMSLSNELTKKTLSRDLGYVDSHLRRLQLQERDALAAELFAL